ncbi:MAG TPA: LysM peptidoglycan-binding domain-containing protein [Anaerolineales bacterium]|nr:LysM peptidoglycan-binding domain-containing protein [Anaerolineales bacterium]
MFFRRFWTLGLALLLAACATSKPSDYFITPASVWSYGQAPSTPTEVFSTPTLSYSLPPTRQPGSVESTPTPDAPHYPPGQTRGVQNYVVQSGDILSAIAERFGVSVPAIVQANNLTNPDALSAGQTLLIPAQNPQAPGPSFKLIPDSELVYGPMAGMFDITAFIQSKHGYLATYSDAVNGQSMTGAQVIQLVAQNFSVNPRLLLALLEYRSGWVTNPNPDASMADMPLGFNRSDYTGLYKQLVLAACYLNDGFYRWQAGETTSWVLSDGTVVPIDPTINPGTAGVENLFGQLDDYPSWLKDVSPGGFYDTYYLLFGSPFDLAIEPLSPPYLSQPPLLLPFAAGEVWSFTGGPHLAWDFGSPFGALDFAPPGDAQGCVESDYWVTAVANGLVTRTGIGVVIEDLDGDGNEGSGWVILYMHVEARDRVTPGTRLRAGDRIGHPSCEGGVSTGTHVHIARRFNGEWVSAIGKTPFNLSGWISAGTGEEYVGTLTRSGVVLTAFEGKDADNQIQR